MNWLRFHLRAWLGIDVIEARANSTAIQANAHSAELGEFRKFMASFNAAFQEVRETREMIQDPKRVPIRTRTAGQYRALMEQEP